MALLNCRVRQRALNVSFRLECKFCLVGSKRLKGPSSYLALSLHSIGLGHFVLVRLFSKHNKRDSSILELLLIVGHEKSSGRQTERPGAQLSGGSEDGIGVSSFFGNEPVFCHHAIVLGLVDRVIEYLIDKISWEINHSFSLDARSISC